MRKEKSEKEREVCTSSYHPLPACLDRAGVASPDHRLHEIGLFLLSVALVASGRADLHLLQLHAYVHTTNTTWILMFVPTYAMEEGEHLLIADLASQGGIC